MLIPDTTEEESNAQALADRREGEDVDADVVAAVHEAVLVVAVTALSPQLTAVVKQLAHGHGPGDGAQQPDQQPLNAQGQAPDLKISGAANIDHCSVYNITEGSTQRRVAVRVGMLARKVMHMVRKNEMRNTGRNTQSESHLPGRAELSSEKMTESVSGRLTGTGMQEQLR